MDDLNAPFICNDSYTPDRSPGRFYREAGNTYDGGFNTTDACIPSDGLHQHNALCPVIMMGVAFSLIPAVMWPAVAYIVKEKRLGSGYALMTLIQQIGMMIFPILVGAANDYAGASAANPQGYNPGMWIFSILGYLVSYLLFCCEKLKPVLRDMGWKRE